MYYIICRSPYTHQSAFHPLTQVLNLRQNHHKPPWDFEFPITQEIALDKSLSMNFERVGKAALGIWMLVGFFLFVRLSSTHLPSTILLQLQNLPPCLLLM